MPNEIGKKETKQFPKPNFEKGKIKTEDKKTKYTPPKPTWEKEKEIIDKKKLIDPTK